MKSISLQNMGWVSASYGLILLLHAPYQVTWVLVMSALLMAWRYRLAQRDSKLPSTWLLLAIALLCAVGIWITFGGISGRDASAAFFTMLIPLKMLESRTQRDFTVVVLLSFFLTICTFLFSQTIPVALLSIAPLLALTTTLVSLNQWHAPADHRALLRSGASMVGLALPLMLVLFVLFPRAPGPLWGVPKDAARAMSGMDDKMSPGSISNLSLSDRVAFRAQFVGKVPDTSLLYWRGPVFWDYDGRVWQSLRTIEAYGGSALKRDTDPVRYSITLEPHNRRWLFVLDMPVELSKTTGFLTEDYQYQSRQPVRTRMRYEASSTLKYHELLELDQSSRNRALRLPDFGNAKSRELAAQWAAATQDHNEIVLKALAFFRDGFQYTLLPPPLGASEIDGFLFDTKKGFCEHYASSFVFLMRAAGVPARVVAGYQGGEMNPLDDYMIVRQSDAHAWAEVWLEGRGWVRVDPTSIVVPRRIDSGIARALPENEPLPALARAESPFKRLNFGWDKINNGWNQWILGYNKQRQTEFLSKLTGSQVTRGDMALWLSLILIALVGGIAMQLLRTIPHKNDPAHIAWLLFQRKLAKTGMQLSPAEGPLSLAVRAAQTFPEHHNRIGQIVQLYLKLRYGAQHDNNNLATLQRLVQEFKTR